MSLATLCPPHIWQDTRAGKEHFTSVQETS